MKLASLDRVLGVAFFAVAAGAALQARKFSVAFLIDPLGPKGFPLLAATLLAAGSLFVVLRPDRRSEFPERAAAGRIAAAVASFVIYALSVAPLGFFLSTALEVAFLARLFGGGVKASLASGALTAAGLWILFALVLGLPLPAGMIFG
ncbi:MAG: hypothetical protein KatS3mg081_1407 [Gemmatimonadales bacterium]|nr:hypothetical protein HRbin33_00625 [bacterium HR33]GIW52052.1 MAG: hypothetical protein KatS3mg081_1407 [Gemmatimonadales bacterium]